MYIVVEDYGLSLTGVGLPSSKVSKKGVDIKKQSFLAS